MSPPVVRLVMVGPRAYQFHVSPIGGRGVGFDMACSGDVSWLSYVSRRQLNSNFFNLINFNSSAPHRVSFPQPPASPGHAPPGIRNKVLSWVLRWEGCRAAFPASCCLLVAVARLGALVLLVAFLALVGWAPVLVFFLARAPTRGPAFLQVFRSLLWDLVPCIRSHASAGQLVVYFVAGEMVGDRQFPGATALGSEFFYFFRQPSRVGRADGLRISRCLLVWTVYEMAGPVRSDGFIFLYPFTTLRRPPSPAVAAAVFCVSTVHTPYFLARKTERHSARC